MFYPEDTSAGKRIYNQTPSKVKCWVKQSLPGDLIRNNYSYQCEMFTGETSVTKFLGQSG